MFFLNLSHVPSRVPSHSVVEEKVSISSSELLLFVLTDGAQNEGYSLNRIKGVVGGLGIPVYTIAYNYDSVEELEELSGINEAAQIKANSDDVVNALRNLFNVNL